VVIVVRSCGVRLRDWLDEVRPGILSFHEQLQVSALNKIDLYQHLGLASLIV
jgi:hypothetical protein